MRIRALIVDDEPLARLGVAARLQAHPDMIVVGECATGEEALAQIESINPDVVFVDIEMPGMGGLEMVRRMRREPARAIVFLTAHEEFALTAFEFEALNYLLKPIDAERFEACVERIRRFVTLYREHRLLEGGAGEGAQAGESPRVGPLMRFTIRRGQNVSFVRAEEVDWIEGMGDYAGLHVQLKTHLIRESLRTLEVHLDPRQFLRIHRSSIVQIDRIVRVQPLANRDAIVTLRDAQTLKASRSYSAGLQKLLRGAGLS